MSFFQNEASVPFDPARFYAPPQKSNVVMSNPFTLPPTDNRPQYLIDRDKEEARASAQYDTDLNKKIVEDAHKETEQRDYDKNPIDYEATKLIEEGINKFGKL
jgi:hypothetical protein